MAKLLCRAVFVLHPDRSLDPDQQEKRHRLTAEINAAYARGDEERIRSMRCTVLPGCAYPMYHDKNRGETGSSKLEVNAK